MSALGALGCANTVTGYLMCTDNMPSGTAMALGDVITIRGGTTVEVINTDAEGRLVMADALVLATEEPVDAIVDIATLTGACMRALGTQVAGVMGNHQGVVDQVDRRGRGHRRAGVATALDQRYRRELDRRPRTSATSVAPTLERSPPLCSSPSSLATCHGPTSTSGPAQTAADASSHAAGCSGFGARLLARLAVDFDGSRS